MLLVIQAIWLDQYHRLSHLGGEYKAKQNHCCKLVVLPEFQSKNFLPIQEHPSVDDSEGKKRLHGVSTAWFIVKWFTVPDFFIHLKQCLPLQSKINEAALSLFCELGISSQYQFCQ